MCLNGMALDHTALSRFRTGRCAEAMKEFFYQYVQLLEKQEEVTNDGEVHEISNV